MIRKANIFDMPFLIEAMREYAKESGIGLLVECENEEHVRKLFSSILAGKGFILVDDELRGFIAAMIHPNIWNDEIYQLSEIAFWVDPGYREGSIGGRLFLAFDKEAQELMDIGRVDMISTSLREQSPRLKYEKYGYKPVESNFMKIREI